MPPGVLVKEERLSLLISRFFLELSYIFFTSRAVILLSLIMLITFFIGFSSSICVVVAETSSSAINDNGIVSLNDLDLDLDLV
ncbi:MAG: hypothetical protein ACI8WT_002108 [Clostridium sp.]|jgi:hypothetical protein